MAWHTDSDAPVIQLDHIAVGYRVAHERVTSLKEHVIRWMYRRTPASLFWALRDVNLCVKRGEMVGIIGKNGAGKSTLLKVIARVLRPTAGRVRVIGAVAPLLEFGAGFHPELTGRENIFLNGALLGFTRAEMRAKFDRIVDFAELREFIDAPLRTYSSGMIARLGFAVATDVEPEILLLDEVLSVGDVAFQQKSFGRIQAFRAAGATILFVSHNHDAVRKLCSRAIWLDHGRVMAEGAVDEVVERYVWQERTLTSTVARTRPGTGRVEITRARLLNAQGEEQTRFATGDTLILEMEYHAHQPTPAVTFGMGIHRQDGVHITGPNTKFAGYELPTLEGRGTVTFTIPDLPLLEGVYQISLSAHALDESELYDYHDRAYPFRVFNPREIQERYGLMTVRGQWSHTRHE